MTSRDFCFWLQGYFEIAGADAPGGITAAQVEMVKKHLALVFKHEIDPAMGDEAHQKALDEVHGGTSEFTIPSGGPVVFRC